jgi:hypothetical protein
MYREVTMIEFSEMLRLWQEQVPKKRIAARQVWIRRLCAGMSRGRSGRPASADGDVQ